MTETYAALRLQPLCVLLKAAETEIITSIDHRNEVPFAEILQEALPTHLDYHLYQRRRLNA